MKYYMEKINNLFRKKLLKSVMQGVYSNAASKTIDSFDTIYFFFNYHLMHFGDQMYFIPLIKKLRKAGLNVYIEPTDNFSFAFEKLQGQKGDLKKCLFVSRVELLSKIMRRFGQVDYLLYDTMSHRIEEPISNYILHSFVKHYELSNVDLHITADDYLNFELCYQDLYELASQKNVIILNNYVDSGRFRISKKRRTLLLDDLKKKTGEFYVVHLGGKRDKLLDHNNYSEIVDLDLRGKTSIYDVFNILSLKNVKEVYCHDTVILHIANLFNKRVNLVFKRYLLHNYQKRTVFSCLFLRTDNGYINYL